MSSLNWEILNSSDLIVQGIEFFIETGFIPNPSPQHVARFLHETDGLSKAIIGEYLGEASVHDKVNIECFLTVFLETKSTLQQCMPS